MDDAVRKNRALAVTQVTLAPGWPIITGIAAQVLKVKEAEALDCEDDTKVIGLQRKAQAAREFLRDWMNEVEKAQHPEFNSPADEFITVTVE